MQCRNCGDVFEEPFIEILNYPICENCRQVLRNLHIGYVDYMVKTFSNEALEWLDAEIDGFYLFTKDNPAFKDKKIAHADGED